ncbi:hypothetical protein AKO1_005999 [Acrasis kona]|uniref:Oxysterol-binding protein n=1 Tax=Acrasis kona TaxID=1008807 RepID=A0AAW2YHC1_9EUKA
MTDLATQSQQEYIYDPSFQGQPSKTNGGSVLYNFFKQMRWGMDLTSITCPAFVLRPQSQLEVQSHIASFTDNLLQLSSEPDPRRRMKIVSQWALNAMSHLPQDGFERVKPYNPILGERFICAWQHKDGTTTSLLSEQVSHHPPISGMYVRNDTHNITYSSTQQMQVQFKGNHIDSKIAGTHVLDCLPVNGTQIERYIIEFPLIIARGIVWGNSHVELGEKLLIRCDSTQTMCEATFKSDNYLDGRLTQNGLVYSKFSGKLLESVKYDGESFVVSQQSECPIQINSLMQSEVNDSRRVWHDVTFALQSGDNDSAASYKNNVEEAQRVLARTRVFEPRYFTMVQGTEGNVPPLFQFVGDKQAL